MQKNDDFVEQYIEECFNAGISKPTDICSKALKDIEAVEVKIEELRGLGVMKNNLVQVLRALNHEEGKNRGRKARAPMINPDITDLDSNPSYLEVLVKICDIIDQASSAPTMAEIIAKSGYDTQDPTPLYQAIKWLFNRGVIVRNEEDRTHMKGPKWDERPCIVDEISKVS